jgi:hypothetical protein
MLYIDRAMGCKNIGSLISVPKIFTIISQKVFILERQFLVMKGVLGPFVSTCNID